MIARALWDIILFCILSFIVGAVGVIITYFIDSPEMAVKLFNSYMISFNGILVGGSGYGLLLFIQSTGKQGFQSLFNILEIPETHKIEFHRYHLWVTDVKRSHFIAIGTTIFGGIILWNCGYPLSGFAKYFLAGVSISMFYVAGLMSGYFFSSLLIFRKLDEVSEQIKIKDSASPYELDNLNLSFLITSTLAVVALYIAFRGTLTANFIYSEGGEVFRRLLIYPIILFLPGILFTSFYYRYVLRKIQENEIIQKIETLESISKEEMGKISGTKEKLEMEKLLIEIREKLMKERDVNSLLTLKDSPALVIALILLIQFVMQNDSELKFFMTYFFK